MVKHTRAIRQQIADESVFDHFVGSALKEWTFSLTKSLWFQSVVQSTT